MERVQKIEADVRALTPEELAAFREWFRAYDADLWDREIEADARAGKLDALADRALEDYRAGKTSPL